MNLHGLFDDRTAFCLVADEDLPPGCHLTKHGDMTIATVAMAGAGEIRTGRGVVVVDVPAKTQQLAQIESNDLRKAIGALRLGRLESIRCNPRDGVRLVIWPKTGPDQVDEEEVPTLLLGLFFLYGVPLFAR